jgi:hypothetical protein
MRKLTSNEAQYVLGMLKERYDALYAGQRDGSIDWKTADEEKEVNRSAQSKLLGHKVKRAGYNYL